MHWLQQVIRDLPEKACMLRLRGMKRPMPGSAWVSRRAGPIAKCCMSRIMSSQSLHVVPEDKRVDHWPHGAVQNETL